MKHSSASRCRVGLIGVSVLLATSACPETSSPSLEDPKEPCKEVGQRCEVSPGKLGSCVVVDNCRGPSCFVCQSQH
jgi:hypothetical protein